LNKILFFTTEFPPLPGGIGMHAWSLAKQLNQHNYPITVVTNARVHQSKEEKSFDLEQPFSVVRVRRFKIVIVTYFIRFVKALKLIKSHDMIICSGKFSLWLINLLQAFHSKKTIAIVHGSELLLPSKKQQKWIHSALRKSNVIIAVSNYTKSLLKDEFIDKAIVINNGFELSGVSTLNDNTEEFTLITVGNLTQRKGQHNVIACLPKLKEIYPDITYQMVGIPTDQEMLGKQAKELGVASRVVFQGRVSESRKINLLQKSKLFLMLSESTPSGAVEGFGIAIIEANALGIPSIGSKGSGIEDAIHDGYSGRLVNPNNVNEVLEAVQEIMQNYEVYSANAMQWASHFKWNVIAKKYVEVLRELEP